MDTKRESNMALDQLVETHFPAQAKLLEPILRTSRPEGRLVLHDFVTRSRIENTLTGSPILHIARPASDTPAGDANGPQGSGFQLADLCYIRRDLEEELGFLPNAIDAAICPRIDPERYCVFGAEIKNTITLFIAEQDRQAELEHIPGLHRLDDYLTYRLFADRRDDIDPVTRLYSRTCLERRARNVYNMGAQETYLVIATDMDHFKRINRDFGAHMGDRALHIVGTEMSKSLGDRGIASRRHYGDELLALVSKSYFQEIDGGIEAWVHKLNSTLAARSTEIGPGVTLKITAGAFDPSLGGTWNQAKIRADNALVYARTRRKPVDIWTPATPALDQLQSGRFTRYKDPSVAEVQAHLSRAFPDGITSEQAAYAREIIDDHVSKSEPIRKQGNALVLDRLYTNMRAANPSRIRDFTPQRVWESVYQIRKNLGLLAPEETSLPREKIPQYLSERLNLEHLLEGPDAEDYNQGFEAFGLCRYDDVIKTISACSESQALSRWIVSGSDKPATGQINTLHELLALLTIPLYFSGTGLVTLSSNGYSVTMAFDQERFDIAPRAKDLGSRTNRVINYFGLEGVSVHQTDDQENNPHYTLKSERLERLQPIFAETDRQVQSETSGTTRLYTIGTELGATIPRVSELLLERIHLDPAYAATIGYTPHTNGNGAHQQQEMTRERAIQLILRNYPTLRAREQLPGVPIFRGTEKEIARLLSDLYVARNVYLRTEKDHFQIRNLRVPDIDTEEASPDEIALHCARQFHKLLSRGKVDYTIERARPVLNHQTLFVELNQLAIPVAHRYEEEYGMQ